jgi:glycine hydroxymethyltransferase
MSDLKQVDPEIDEIVAREEARQRGKLELIASENFVSKAVLEAAGSVLTNKYAEGYPGNRYYGGCEVVDLAENLARDRANELFGSVHANVQPHSGSNANMAVYATVLKPGDTILGMDLYHGGHLTHGSDANFSGKLYHFVHYGVRRDDELIDYEQVESLAKEHRPKLIVAGASTYSRTIDFERFKAIAEEVDAYFMVDMAHIAGLIAAQLHPSPVPHADFVSSTTHKTLRGPRGGLIVMGKDSENKLGVVARKSGRTRMLSELLDSAVMPGVQGGPLMHIIAAKAVAFKEALSESFRVYQQRIVNNAAALSASLSDGGARIISGGTDTHLMMVDVTGFGLTGKAAQVMLDEANISVNKNAIPFDTRSALVTSGIRLGTPALTTRGMEENEMAAIATLILEVLRSNGRQEVLESVGKRVTELCAGFPLADGLG